MNKLNPVELEIRKMHGWAKRNRLPIDITKWCDQDFVEYEKSKEGKENGRGYND